jgi:DNA (cytosine-5)-methyltransferase 1
MPARTTSETDALLSWTGAMRAHDTPQLTAVAPLRTISAGGNHAYLVVPYRRGARPYRAESGPLSTVATREQHGVMVTDEELMDCRFRMLKPIEHGRAQRFRDDYKVLGNGSEQTMQYGNAVASNVTQFLGAHAIRTLDGAT